VLGVVLELFIVEEELLAGRENKIGAAAVALQNSVGKLHGRHPQTQGNSLKSAIVPRCLPVPVSLSTCLLNNKGPGRKKFSGKFSLQQPPATHGEAFLHVQNTICRNDRTKQQHVMTGRSSLVIDFLPGGFLPGVARAALIIKWLKTLLVSLFASLLAIPLACQCCLHAALLTGLQIVGVTLYFLDNVLLLYLPFKPA
jgi:hypothetical protein